MRSVYKNFIIICLVACGICLGKSTELERWKEILQCRKAEGNIQFAIPRGGNAKPCVFMLVKKENPRAVRVTLDQKRMILEELLPNDRYVNLATVDLEQQSDKVHKAQMTFKIRDNEWNVYEDGKYIGGVVAPFSFPGTVRWPMRPGVKLASAMKYHPVADASYKTDFMIEPGAPNELYPWTIQQGKWHIHTALAEAIARPETDQARTKAAPLTADKSPNFYSLKGGGDSVDSVITLGYDFYDNYSLTGSMQLDEGEAGIVFLHRDEIVPAPQPGEEPIAPNPEHASYYALTIRMDVPFKGNRDIRLWKYENGVKTVLARANVPLYQKQWYLPGIRIYGDKIVCMLDEYELFHVREKLPVGGKAGLYANTKEQIRFDDITLKPNTGYDLSDYGKLQRNVMYASKNIQKLLEKYVAQDEKQGTYYKPQETLSIHLENDKHDRQLVIGRHDNKDMYFSVNTSNIKAMSLVGGWQDAKKPHFIFTIFNTGNTIKCLLEKAEIGNIQQLDSYEFKNEITNDLKLAMDCTESGTICCYVNGFLVLSYENKQPVMGGYGFIVPVISEGDISNITLNSKHERVVEKEQPNPIFKEDNFMRHWASPEGQWINGANNTLWHKGDFFNDFSIRLPLVLNSQLHMGVPDGEDKKGQLVLAVDNGGIVLNSYNAEQEQTDSITAKFANNEAQEADKHFIEARCNGSFFTVYLDNEKVLSKRLDGRLKNGGSRVYASGMTLAHMAKSKVTRINVLDDYFNESPHSWVTNGGDWQIINRFQCTPSWSHMIGEAVNGLGALWMKKQFKGDMVMEFYAGTRHEHYDQAGNLNCTIMAKDTTPSSGYTFTCTEWDHNESQNWSKFYVNGVEKDKSDSYLVPRRRKGMVRRVLNPLISQGRPYHGAWFYIKVRKIGNKIEYYFDDEVIMTEEAGDKDDNGIAGIWTFIHSMTVAQVKVTFDEMASRPINVSMLPLEDKIPDPEVPWERKGTVNKYPVNAMSGKYWSHEDDGVSQCTFECKDDSMSLRSNLGGGNMRILADLPVISMEKLAGWRFQVKCTPDAKFNFFYYIGQPDAKGNFSERLKAFHRLTGDSFAYGSWKISGSTDIKGDDWQEVTVWLPRYAIRMSAGLNALVKVGGFGLEQKDFMSSGINGNGPGATYAIRNFRPIFYGAPAIEGMESYTCKMAGADVEDINAALQGITDTVASADVAFASDADTFSTRFDWINLPEEPDYTLEWYKGHRDAVCIRQNASYYDPRFALATMTCEGERIVNLASSSDINDTTMVFPLPNSQKIADGIAKGSLEFKIHTDRDRNVTLAVASDNRLNHGPTLQKIDGLTPFYEAFEQQKSTFIPQTNGQHLTLLSDMSGQGQFLDIQNHKYGDRLAAHFNMPLQEIRHIANVPRKKNGKPNGRNNQPLSLTDYPVVQFRYRAWDMDYITLMLDNNMTGARLTEGDFDRAVKVRLAEDLKFDEKWHTWTGVLSDAVSSPIFRTTKFQSRTLNFVSGGRQDQTGNYSRMNLDDVTVGPAIHSMEELSFTPEYFDLDGVAKIYATILPGETSAYDTDKEKLDALVWKEYKPGEKIEFAENSILSDGISHVIMYAVDTASNKSSMFDVPFMLDRVPLATRSYVKRESSNDNNGAMLNVDFLNNEGGAPLVLDRATFFIDGKYTRLDQTSNRHIHYPNADSLQINYPLIFKEQLDKASNGDTLTLEIDNIMDGAGNQTPRLSVPIKVDYAADKNGPNWISLNPDDSVCFYVNWDGESNNKYQFATMGRLSVVERNPGQSPCLVTKFANNRRELPRNVEWNLGKYPFISFRMAMRAPIHPNTGVVLTLTTTDNRMFTLSLSKPGQEANELNKDTTFTWTQNEWKNLAFDIRDCIAKAQNISRKDANAISIKTISFRFANNSKPEDTYALDDLFIHGVPEQGAVFKWQGYDESGVAGLVATAVSPDGKDLWIQRFPGYSLDMNTLCTRFKGHCWFRCQAVDKAGNLSVPCWIPVVSN